MAEPVPISLGRGSNKGRHGPEGVAAFVNCYVEHLGEGGKVEWPIYAINGLDAFGDALTGGGLVRAMLTVDAQVLIVSGRQLFATNIGGSPMTLVGGIASDGFVTMARNRRSPNPQVAIVCDGLWYIYTSGTLTQGTDPDLPPPIAVVEVDGFFVFVIADGRWYISAVDDATIDGLDFTEAQSSPDQNVMAAVRGRELIIMGQRSLEFYVDNGGQGDFPFTRIQTARIGCYAAGSVQQVILQPPGGSAVDSVIWAATDSEGTYAGIRVLDGYSGTQISNTEVDILVRAEPNPADLRSKAWTEDEHSFYEISGTAFSMRWDSGTGQWFQVKSFGLDRHRTGPHAQIGQVHLFGDYATNLLYASNPDTFDEVGEVILMQVVTPPVHMFPNPFIIDEVFIDAITGVGVNSSADEDASPQLMLDYSDDGGQSFGGLRQIDLGADAQRHVQLRETSFGRFGANGVSFRLSCSARVVWGLLAAAVTARKLKMAA
jgi:hypothetical protein